MEARALRIPLYFDRPKPEPTYFDSMVGSRRERAVACVTVDGNAPATMLFAFRRDESSGSTRSAIIAQLQGPDGAKVCATLQDFEDALVAVRGELERIEGTRS